MLNALQNRVTATAGGRWAAMLIGTFAGTLPGVLAAAIISNLGRISSLTGMVVILGAIFGYKWSRMPLRPPGFLYISALSIVMIFAGELLAVWMYGVFYLCKEYGVENFWVIATGIVPQMIREVPELTSDILFNGCLSALFAIPAGLFLFSNSSHLTASADGSGPQPAALRPCLRDSEGNLYLAMGRVSRGFALFVPVVATAALCMLLLNRDGGLLIPAAVGIVALLSWAACAFCFRLRYTLTDQGLSTRLLFGARLIPYDELRQPPGEGKILLKERFLLLPRGDGWARILNFNFEGVMEFVQELSERTRLEMPWNYRELIRK